MQSKWPIRPNRLPSRARLKPLCGRYWINACGNRSLIRLRRPDGGVDAADICGALESDNGEAEGWKCHGLSVKWSDPRHRLGSAIGRGSAMHRGKSYRSRTGFRTRVRDVQ